MKRLLKWTAPALLSLFGSVASAQPGAPYPADPLQSPMWEAHARTLFGEDPVRFDPRLRVLFPQIAENQRSFPVMVDARGLGRVERMLIFADLNPIPLAVDYRPIRADAYVATRIKLDQRTPVRGAVRLSSGEWLVSGGWVDAAGGGCSAPPVSRVKGDWAEHLGEIRGGAWPASDGVSRLRLTFRHPMDTGFVANVPTYHIDRLTIADAFGELLGEMDIWASVAEDPAITVIPRAQGGASLAVTARDTNGRVYSAKVIVARQSPFPSGGDIP
ncbi:quinoprotein dehydrogenase-associated SoxYZ-like carrier [Sphingobium sp. CCH11-B1]|jgi:sulfur-oxidizing protein SoxY|uniref:quinoprotein dehydrogenase-associated SoxYZ-like carrier n=1 Tax=Sphingobium sp. CCH11-B1 TaxID=1768781 RepID=UPI00082D178F|nr:quinoprotein dehydrogenase-associated SoxYZ-like carrier [Sphingobium sp. CCH11-B1]MEA3390956.1 quinoprotein dehydrogenase-associated SoxYZ-like carrier [Pseudomonadota bacterium]